MDETKIPQPPGGCKLHGKAEYPGMMVLELQGRFFPVSSNPFFLTQEDAWKFWQMVQEDQQRQRKKIHIVDAAGAHIN